MSQIQIVIADDYPLFRDGVRALLDSVDDTILVGEAGTGEDVVTLARELAPDVVLMDIKMAGMSGIEATRRIVEEQPSVAVLMLTMFEDDDSVFAAMRAGARGYLLKGARQEETLRAIRAVANGEAIFSPGIAERVMRFLTSARLPDANPAESFPQLTERELEILELLAHRCSNAAIAERLVLSPKTVRNHVSNILHKLSVADRADAMRAARAAGMGSGV